MGLISNALGICREGGFRAVAKRAYVRYRPGFLNTRFGAKETLRRPSVLLGHIKYNVLWPINERYHSFAYQIGRGEDIFERDWDNLILLDSCRPDMFKSVNSIEGELRTIRSKAGRSYTFMKRNFEKRKLHDTVYVCANSHFSKFGDEIFHDVENVWKNKWNDTLDTVQPSAVTDNAIEAHEKYPNKRLIVHYMQPHTPFIGESAQKFLSKTRHPKVSNLSGYSVLGGIKHGLIDINDSRLLRMYEENTKVALDEVRRLLREINGKTVISSDHGELVGERVGPLQIKFYGHGSLFRSELRDVPWFVISSNERRYVTSSPPVRTEQSDENRAQEQLESLGYV